jgi:hypothetical protein
VYCGAPLSQAVQETARAAAEAVLHPAAKAVAAERAFVVYEVGAADAATLAPALGVSRYEAEQRRRRGGVQLDRLMPRDEAERRAARLVEARLKAAAIPESEALPARSPRLARGGQHEAGTLRLRLETGILALGARDLRLVVRGPIAREYQARDSARHQVRTATVEPGYRFALHLVTGVPIEIDPWSFELGRDASGSTLLAVSDWIAAVALGVPVDDAFRWLTPALAPETSPDASAVGAASLVRARAAQGRGEPAVVLDNVAQFRTYSGWRGAWEARRAR